MNEESHLPETPAHGMSDMEALAMTAKEVAGPLVEAFNARTASDERVAIHRIDKEHDQQMYDKKSSNVRFYVVSAAVMILGCGGALVCYLSGKPDLASNLLVGTMTQRRYL